MDMLGVLDPVSERIVLLADDYAEMIVASLPHATPEDILHGISGAMLSFLRDAVDLAA